MIINKIEVRDGKKYRVFVDDEFLCSLYNKEIKQLHIQEGNEISKDMIDYILNVVIYKRAKERALFLLERKPLSVHMMISKLRDNDYPPVVIEKVIVFLKRYHYLDDEEYVKMYVSSYSRRKSKKQLIVDLQRKGISKATIEYFFENNEYSEHECFEQQFNKYIRGKNLQDYSVRQKVFRYFYNKGFSGSIIETYMKSELL